MTTFRSEEGLVGLIAAALVPWVAWTVLRGTKAGRLPIGRGHVVREERAGAYRFLLAFYIVSGLAAAMICLDLLFAVRLDL